MDPNAAWKALRMAMAGRDREGIAEHAGALVGWLEKGGFIPDRSDIGRPLEGLTGEQLRPVLLWYLRDVRAVAEM